MVHNILTVCLQGFSRTCASSARLHVQDVSYDKLHNPCMQVGKPANDCNGNSNSLEVSTGTQWYMNMLQQHHMASGYQLKVKEAKLFEEFNGPCMENYARGIPSS